jgi:hypothetical protein
VFELRTGDAEIAYWDEGSGELLPLVPGPLSPDWFLTLARKLTDRARVPGLRSHRATYCDSRDLAGDLNVTDHAGHLGDVLREQRIDRAHIMGHPVALT